MTLTADMLDTLHSDLQLVAHHLACCEDASDRRLDAAADAARERASSLLDALIECVEAWAEDAEGAPVEARTSTADAAEPDSAPPVLALAPPLPEPEPEPTPPPGDTEPPGQFGAFDVKTLRGQRFVRCPEILCGVRVHLDPDDSTEADVAALLEIHRNTCLARTQSPPAKKAKR